MIVPLNQTRTLDRKQAAKYLGVCVMTIDRALAKGELPHYRIGRRVLFDPERHLEQFLRRHEVAKS